MSGATAREPLLLHQREFIDKFFSSGGSHVLQSAVGYGASRAVAHLVRRALDEVSTARVLILAPKALQAQMQRLLMDLGVKAEAVDRFRYRELLDATPSGASIWRSGEVFILSMEFAMQEDIARSLKRVAWSYIVVDQAHRLKRSLREELQSLIASSPNLRLLMITPSDGDDILVPGSEQFQVTRWHYPALLRGAESDLHSRRLQFIEFHESHGERAIRETVGEILAQLQESTRVSVAEVLAAALASSPAALEQTICRLRSRLVQESDHSPLEEAVDVFDTVQFGMRGDADLVSSLNRCLAQLESLAMDSKVSKLIDELQKPHQSAATAIVTEFGSTLFYLQAQLEEAGLEISAVSGTMAEVEKTSVTDRFARQDGILLATGAALQGLELPRLDWLILYDFPTSPIKSQLVYRRFRGSDQSTLSVLINAEATPPAVAKALASLNDVWADTGVPS